jgi:putative SOS response-associated peptidase YedK
VCGRFTLAVPSEEVGELFGLPTAGTLSPRYNIAPSQAVAAVRIEAGQRRLVMLRWGLLPSWADDLAIGNRMINARAESVAEKPSFRQAFRARRCLVAADGFFEWQKREGGKRPFHIRMRDGRPFAFAGLWERWTRGKEPVESCTLLTTTANALIRPIHDRMPVIVAPGEFDLWLDPQEAGTERVRAVLRPFSAEAMVATPVGDRVNNPRNDDPECIAGAGG